MIGVGYDPPKLAAGILMTARARRALFLARLAVLAGSTLLIAGCSGPPLVSPRASVGAPSLRASVSGLASALPASVLPGEPWIAYISLSPAGELLSLVRPDGTGDHSILADLGLGFGRRADWSRDGSQLVFVLDFNSIWLASADGSAVRNVYSCVTPCENIDHPAISPDGSRIAFERNDTQDGTFTGTTIEILDLASRSVQTAIASGSPRRFIKYPRWSPDGRSLVVEVERVDEDVVLNGPFVQASASAIAVADISGALPASLTTLTGAGLLAAFPDWNPVDGRIVFATNDLGEFEQTDKASNLYAIAADGTGLTQLSHLTGGLRAGEPSWTPDGLRIIFTTLDDLTGDRQIAFLDPDGGASLIVDHLGMEARLRPTP